MITRTFYTLFFSIVISDIIIYFTHINNLGHTLWRTLWFVPSILLIAGLVTVMFARKQFYMIDKAHIASFYFMLCLAITIPKCVFAVTYLTKYAVQQFTTADVDRIFTNIALGLGLATFAIIAIGTLWGWRKAVTTRVTVSSSKLPDTFDGLKIVHISDIHASTWSTNPRDFIKIVAKINAENADVIMFTGDLITHRTSELAYIEKPLRALRAKYGIYSVLGNHDYSPYYPWRNIMDKKRNLEDLISLQKDMGWKLLNNTHDYLRIDNDSIAVIGVENWGDPPFSKYGNLPMAMQGVDDKCYKILLTHNPAHWEAEVKGGDIDLTLSGHTHAMQFKLFGLSLSRLKYRYWNDLHKVGDQYICVNEGLGCTLIPFRFGSWPEITVITLHKAKE